MYRGKRPTDERHPLRTYTNGDIRFHQHDQRQGRGILTFTDFDALRRAVCTIPSSELQIYSLSANDHELGRDLGIHQDHLPYAAVVRPRNPLSRDQFDSAIERVQAAVVEIKGRTECSSEKDDNVGSAVIRALNTYGRELIADTETVNEGLFCRVVAVLVEDDDSWLHQATLTRKDIDLLGNALASYRRRLIRSMSSADINDIAELNIVMDLLHEKIPLDELSA